MPVLNDTNFSQQNKYNQRTIRITTQTLTPSGCRSASPYYGWRDQKANYPHYIKVRNHSECTIKTIHRKLGLFQRPRCITISQQTTRKYNAPAASAESWVCSFNAGVAKTAESKSRWLSPPSPADGRKSPISSGRFLWKMKQRGEGGDLLCSALASLPSRLFPVPGQMFSLFYNLSSLNG